VAHLATLAELLDLKGDPTVAATGVVLEAQMQTGMGPLARVLVKEGTLRNGDFIVCGPAGGRVRTMRDYRGKVIKEATPGMPVEVAGLDVRPESLPDDPASTALALWRRGEAREALGLLYRAAIARIVDRFEVPIVDGDTEGLCLFRVRTARVPDVETFGELTATWQGCAYGERVPDDAGFDGLVRRWRAAYGAATVAAGAQEAGR